MRDRGVGLPWRLLLLGAVFDNEPVRGRIALHRDRRSHRQWDLLQGLCQRRELPGRRISM